MGNSARSARAAREESDVAGVRSCVRTAPRELAAQAGIGSRRCGVARPRAHACTRRKELGGSRSAACRAASRGMGHGGSARRLYAQAAHSLASVGVMRSAYALFVLPIRMSRSPYGADAT